MTAEDRQQLEQGSYTLLIRNTDDRRLSIGALGERSFPAGIYLYNGSAQGSGGFTRISRHQDISTGDRTTQHWHIDYLLAAGTTSIETVVVAAGDHECAISQALSLDAVPGFGASDCACNSHLLYGTDAGVRDAVVTWYRENADAVDVRDSY